MNYMRHLCYCTNSIEHFGCVDLIQLHTASPTLNMVCFKLNMEDTGNGIIQGNDSNVTIVLAQQGVPYKTVQCMPTVLIHT